LTADRCLDASPQTRWRDLARKSLMNKLLQRCHPPALGGKRRISAYPLRDFQGVGRIELAIQICMD
jgi:hypothetical protein